MQFQMFAIDLRISVHLKLIFGKMPLKFKETKKQKRSILCKVNLIKFLIISFLFHICYFTSLVEGKMHLVSGYTKVRFWSSTETGCGIVQIRRI